LVRTESWLLTGREGGPRGNQTGRMVLSKRTEEKAGVTEDAKKGDTGGNEIPDLGGRLY